MNDYNKAQIDYRDGCKARIKRQMEISKLTYYSLPILAHALVSPQCLLYGFSLDFFSSEPLVSVSPRLSPVFYRYQTWEFFVHLFVSF